MIKKVKIENFKSVQNLELELGRVNVLIGENGCGKTNVLEAIAIGSAATENKLGNEFLFARGVRITDPQFMTSAFDTKFANRGIVITFQDEKHLRYSFFVSYQKNIWTVRIDEEDKIKIIAEEFNNSKSDLEKFILAHPLYVLGKERAAFEKKWEKFIFDNLPSPFLIFTPENSKLRQFQEEGQILPLGIGGQGLFKHLVTLYKEYPAYFEKIKKQLEIIDWFEDLQVPADLMFTERRMNIKDRFLHPDLQFFDQRSANEGFLYLLFYFTLFISDSTPKFFAIDNIDNALNPKLCSKLIHTLSQLAKEHQKQVIITTHNPSILDGLDLDDDDQRLFVIYRNADGHTIAKRVQKKEQVNGAESVRLSEAFIRGYLGGLPKNF